MKRRTFIVYIALFLIYILLIVTAFLGLERYSSASSKANSSSCIIIDAGHGGDDGGAVDNGIVEKDINLSVSKMLCGILRASGFNVIMTRNSDKMINNEGSSLRERKVSDMKNRLSIYNSNPDNIVISIHQNKFNIERYSGAQVFYGTKNNNSIKLAESIKNSFKALLQPDNKREIKPSGSNIYLLNNSDVCSVIVECGFISNVYEASLLKNEVYKKKLAFTIYNGLLDYLNNV